VLLLPESVHREWLSTATLEHKEPRMYGGSDAIENLAAACLRCNLRRGRRMYEPLRIVNELNQRLLSEEPGALATFKVSYRVIPKG
jgi:5-methylcytosine-specific restriction endonuclease McrA